MNANKTNERQDKKIFETRSLGGQPSVPDFWLAARWASFTSSFCLWHSARVTHVKAIRSQLILPRKSNSIQKTLNFLGNLNIFGKSDSAMMVMTKIPSALLHNTDPPHVVGWYWKFTIKSDLMLFLWRFGRCDICSNLYSDSWTVPLILSFLHFCSHGGRGG